MTHTTTDAELQTPTSARMPLAAKLTAAALLLWMAVIVTLAQYHMAPTYDEQNHVTRGIAIYTTGDYRLCLDHPPLANIVQALPLIGRASGFSTALPEWQAGNTWRTAHATMWANPQAGVAMVHLARLTTLLFTLGLGVVILLWASSLFGPWAGVLALGLYTLDPTVLAHGGLATTDAAAACTIALALYLLRGYLRQPTRPRLLLAGIGMGLAQAAKFSALILFPISGLLLLLLALWPAVQRFPAHWQGLTTWTRVRRAVGLCAMLWLISGVTVWGIYGFKVEPLGSKPGKPMPANASFTQRLPVPAMQYFRGVKNVKKQAEHHPAYLLGQTDSTGKGWWYYFPVALATKTPAPELVMMTLMLCLLALPRIRRRLHLPGYEYLILLLPIGIYLYASLGLLGIKLNLGVRHALPMFPFLLILAGAWAALAYRHWLIRAALGAALAVQIVSVLSAYPDFLAYFNEPSGGTARGYRILIDSNYDWGQDVAALARYQQTHALEPLGFSYFGTVPPEAYGLQYTPLAGMGVMDDASAPDLATYHGYLAVSATVLYGGPGYARADYRPLLQQQPVARAGRTIFIYHLTPGGDR